MDEDKEIEVGDLLHHADGTSLLVVGKTESMLDTKPLVLLELRREGRNSFHAAEDVLVLVKAARWKLLRAKRTK